MNTHTHSHTHHAPHSTTQHHTPSTNAPTQTQLVHHQSLTPFNALQLLPFPRHTAASAFTSMFNFHVSSEEECMVICQRSKLCNWFTYSGEIKACVLMLDCPNLEEGCSSCISGESRCSSRGTSKY